MTNRELDAWIATYPMGEPMPTPPSAWDGELAMIGSGRLSEGGNWRVCSDYESGDIPYWLPRNYTEDRNAATLVLQKVEEFGLAEEWAHQFILLNVSKSSWLWKVARATPRQLMDAVKKCWEAR